MKYVLFDLDGTLTDPGIGITNCVAHALANFNIHVENRSELYPYIGPPLTDSFMKYHGLDEEQALIALQLYRERFSSIGIFENELIPGIPELLKSLKEKGLKLIVATSKPEEYTVRILEHYGLAEYFDFVGGNTLNEDRPTKSEVIEYVLQNCKGMNKDNAIMVGDRLYDVKGAHAFGIPAIGVLFGYGSRAELESAGADYIASDVKELQNILEVV